MSNFLKNNQKTEIRARISNDIILYEPSEEQIIKLKELMQEQQIKFDDNLNATGNVSYDAVRYIIKELCKDGEWVDEYTDEQLDNEFANGNRYVRKLQNEIILLLEEIVEDIQYEMYTQIKAFNSVLNIVDKETEENTNKQKHIPCSSTGTMSRLSIATKAISKCTDCNHSIIANGIFHRNRNIPNISLQQLRTLNSQKDSKKNTPGGIFLSDFKRHPGAVVTTTVRNWHKRQHTDYRNRIEGPGKPACVWPVSS